MRRDKALAAREKELLAVRGQFEKARIAWESNLAVGVWASAHK